MPVFYYHARDAQRRVVAGELSAASVDDAIGQLEGSGLIIEAISRTPLPAPTPTRSANDELTSSAESRTAAPDPNLDAVAVATDSAAELRQLVRSHLAAVVEKCHVLVPALEAFAAELPAGRQRRELLSVVRTLNTCAATTSSPDADVLAELNRLPHYWLPLLSAATHSRDPGRMLRQFLDESQRASDLRWQAWRALIYPAIIGVTASAVFVFYSLVVIPIFRQMFEEFGLVIPTLTAAVLTVSTWVENGKILAVLAATVAIGATLVYAIRWLPATVRVWFGDRCVLPSGRATSLARFTRYAADLLEAGAELPHAVQLAGHATGIPRMQRAAWRLSRSLESADSDPSGSVSDAFSHTVLFALVSPMSTTARIRWLRELSECQSDRADGWMSWSRGIVEPIAVCVVGVVVGFITIALFLPLISLTMALA